MDFDGEKIRYNLFYLLDIFMHQIALSELGEIGTEYQKTLKI